MKRNHLLLALAVLAASAASALTLAPAARADCVSDAAVAYVGSDWGPVPMWRVSVPALNASWDVLAADADEARADVAPLISCPAAPAPTVADPTPADPTVAAPDAAAPAEPTPAPTSATDEATAILVDAEVTYVGDSWGPLPIWRVDVPSRGETYDVAAATADDARTAVLGALTASIDANPTVPAAAAVTASDAATLAAADPGQAVSVDAIDASPVAPAPAVVKATPAKAKTARRGLHQEPATAKLLPQ